MNFAVCGCGLSFKATGLRCHQRQSLDIRCKTEGPQFDDSDYADGDCDMDTDPQNFIMDVIENTSGAEFLEFKVDPAGDLFGDYEDYIPGEFGTDCLDSNVCDD